MLFAGHAASSYGCVARPKGQETGLNGSAVPIQHSLPTGSYVMEMAEHREPYEPRGSRTVLGERGGEIPPRHSTCVDGSLLARVILIFMQIGRVLSCVRPVNAAHMAAGPNAIRWIGSQSKARALCALTQTGFPNPRFDRFCITSLSLCQTL